MKIVVFVGVARRMEEHGDELWKEDRTMSIGCAGRRTE
jgi:hypothetical protein